MFRKTREKKGARGGEWAQTKQKKKEMKARDRMKIQGRRSGNNEWPCPHLDLPSVFLPLFTYDGYNI